MRVPLVQRDARLTTSGRLLILSDRDLTGGCLTHTEPP
jgi:hypothetical protein